MKIRPTCKLQAIMKKAERLATSMGTVCRLRGSEKLPEEFKRILGIEAGETTPDGKFFPDCLWCVGAYGLLPVIMIKSL